MNNSDPVSHAEKLRHVIAELRSYHGEKRDASSEYTFVLCPFHSEKTPSGQIFHGPQTRLPGYFLCRGCGEKGNWNKVAPYLGLKPFTRQKAEDAYSVPLAKKETEAKAERLKFKELPRKKVWRSIKTNFLISIGAKYGYKWLEDYDRWSQKFIWLPVHVGGDLKGYIKARIKKDPEGKFPSYLNKKGAWSKRTGLFPFDPAIELMKELHSSTVVLVEGPRDALRLLSYGIPCMAILGTTSWTMFKPELLELHGVKQVLVMMDGDDAGIAASKLVIPDLKKLLKVKRIKLWDLKGSPYHKYAKLKTEEEKKAYKHNLWDPGNCPEWVLDRIKSKYFER